MSPKISLFFEYKPVTHSCLCLCKCRLTKQNRTFFSSLQVCCLAWLLVEANFVDMPEALKDGTQLQANFIIGEKKNVWVIPTIYLSEGDSVLLTNSHKKVGVKTGIKTLEWVEILRGITGNDVLDLPKEK